MVNQTVEYVGDQNKLAAMIEGINSASVLALDIETINWWDREAERVALVQLGFRQGSDPTSPIRVAIIDALAGIDLSALRLPLELSLTTKVIHNASYDAVRMARHFGIFTSPIFDTMLAARRSGEKKCSLKAQVETHLGFEMDKTEQRSDWGRRPLTREQLEYAALDASCTLLLYERQIARGLRGDYELPAERIEKPRANQAALPLSDGALRINTGQKATEKTEAVQIVSGDLSLTALALLGIVTELSGRYSPEQLAVSVGSERIGMAGWIVDRVLPGEEEDIDQAMAKQEIAALSERGLIQISLSHRLEATTGGAEIWLQNKPKH
ncbi:MAG: ribonuclease D [Blastocatellia bacterium]